MAPVQAGTVGNLRKSGFGNELSMVMAVLALLWQGFVLPGLMDRTAFAALGGSPVICGMDIAASASDGRAQGAPHSHHGDECPCCAAGCASPGFSPPAAPDIVGGLDAGETAFDFAASQLPGFAPQRRAQQARAPPLPG